jgi:hypothetical protein
MAPGSRRTSALIVAVSALVFAVLGLLWTHLTGLWQGGGSTCAVPIPLPGHRVVGGCGHYPPQWGWALVVTVTGALAGATLAIVALTVCRLAGRHSRHTP